MVHAIRNRERPGIASMAIAAVDMALWDLKARPLDVSLVTLLGAARDAVPVYGSGGCASYPLEHLQAQLGGWVEQGIPRVKMKIGTHPAQAVPRVRAAREVIGPDAALYVDANGAYSRKRALAQAERFRECGVVWFEEPVSSDDLDGLRLIRDRAPAGMDSAAGKYGYDLWYFRWYAEARNRLNQGEGDGTVIVLGDVHRRWEDAAEALAHAGVRGRTIVQAGDFGLGFGDPERERRRLADLGAALAAAGNRLLVVRGNHDNPALFHRPAALAGGTIQVVPDYTIEAVEGHRVLFAGGAISVDRKLRQAGRSYWPDEAFVLDLDHLAALDLSGLDAVVTHTAPGIAPPNIDGYGRFTGGSLPEPPAGFRVAIQRLYERDDRLAADILAERRRLDALYKALRDRVAVPHWIYGHFHHHVSRCYEETLFTMVDELQVLEVDVEREAAPSLLGGQPLP